MFGLDGIAVDFADARLEIECGEIEPVLAGNEGENFFEVGAQFFRGVGAAGVVTSDGQTAARIAGGGGFEPADVIALPLMDGNQASSEDFERFFGIHAEPRRRYLALSRRGRA